MRRTTYIEAILVALATAIAVALAGCSQRKNTAATRKYQAFITRYNIYYNGDEHYKETLKQMENDYADDYSQLLFAHPADARRDESAPQPSGDFTRSIEKAQKAIQLRSIKKKPAKKSGRSSDPAYKAWMKREEYNPFLHNAWMMMGRSQYLNGDFLGAAATFYYISRHFTWLPATVTEARIWQARCYCSMGWDFEAENILMKVTDKDLADNRRLRDLYNLAQSSYWSRTKEPAKAIPYLEKAAKSAKGSQKSRLNFLLGQIYQGEGRNADAYQAYRHACTASSPYRTQVNARIRQSEVYSGTSIEPEVKALRRMTRYDRNKDYLDQIYYAIGNLYLSRGDTVNAIDNYKLAAEKSTRNGVEKAISQLALGRLYFQTRRYELAQPCYSDAVSGLPKSYPGLDSIKRRSDVLDELAVYSQNVTLNDSLLRLAAMDSTERLAVIDKIIADLKKAEEEEAERLRREEYLAEQQANGQAQNAGNAASAPSTFTINTDDSWYFYNTATRNAGRTEFQKRWGARKLEDDWRRRNKATFSFDDFESTDNDEESSDNADTTDTADGSEAAGDESDANADLAADPHNREYYLRQIPSTPEEVQTANDVIQEGLYNIGLILKDQLEDYDAAADDWLDLNQRYPDNIYRLDVYYNMYMMYMRDGRTALAEEYRDMLLSQFPESNYAAAMRDPDYIGSLRRMNAEQETLYEQAYSAYLDNRNDEVHAAYRDMAQRYPLSKIMPKFMFIDALSYVTENKPEEFRSTLKEMLERYPQTDMTELASAYLKSLAQGRKLHAGATNTRGMLWDLRLSNDSAFAEGDSIVAFDLNPDVPQLLIFVYPTDEVNANQLLYDVAYFNFSTFVVRDFDLEQMSFGRLGLLLVKGFANFEELTHYRKVMDDDSRLLLPPEVRPVMISADDFDKLIRAGRSFDDYFRYVDAQAEEAPVVASPGLTDEPATQPDETTDGEPDNLPDVGQE